MKRIDFFSKKFIRTNRIIKKYITIVTLLNKIRLWGVEPQNSHSQSDRPQPLGHQSVIILFSRKKRNDRPSFSEARSRQHILSYKNENKIRQYSTIKFFDGLVVLN